MDRQLLRQNIPSKILSNENEKKPGVSGKIVCFGILIHVLKTTETSVFMFSLLRFFDFLLT